MSDLTLPSPTAPLPTSPTLDSALGEAGKWVAAQESSKAIERYNELLEMYPEAVRVLQARAKAFELSGEVLSAADDYRRVLEIVPADDEAMIGLARCLRAVGEPREASALARQALDYNPRNVEARMIAGDDAIGKPPEGMIARSRALLRGGIAGRAITLMRRMNEAEPDRVDVQVHLAEMLWQNGLRITTAELCQAILDEAPDCLNAHALLSAIWTQAGSSDLAALHRRAVEKFDPDFRFTCIWLGERSPFEVRDVPAEPKANAPAQAEGQAEQTPPGVEAAPKAETEAEVEVEGGEAKAPDGEQDNLAWVNELIAASGPVTPPMPATEGTTPTSSAGAEPPADAQPAANSEIPNTSQPTGTAGAAGAPELPGHPSPTTNDSMPSDVYGGEVVGGAPLEWTPAVVESEDTSEVGASAPTEDLPGWLRDLQSRAAAQPAVENEHEGEDSSQGQASEVKAPEARVPKSPKSPKAGKQESLTAGGPLEWSPWSPTDEEMAASAGVAPEAEAETQEADDLASTRRIEEGEGEGVPEDLPEDLITSSEGDLKEIPEENPDGSPEEGPEAGLKESLEQTPVESTPADVEQTEATEPEPRAGKAGTGSRKRGRKVKPSSDEKLSLARKALEAGQYEEAAAYYSGLISAGKRLDVVLADLDVAVHTYPDVSRFHTLLGDIYTRKGDVNAALAAYHRALESQ